MSKVLCSLQVKGDRFLWGFDVYVDPGMLEHWQIDGLDIRPVLNTIPEWLPLWFPVRWWCFLQDVWNLKNPWSKT